MFKKQKDLDFVYAAISFHHVTFSDYSTEIVAAIVLAGVWICIRELQRAHHGTVVGLVLVV